MELGRKIDLQQEHSARYTKE